jgi:copper chaperone CopZ
MLRALLFLTLVEIATAQLRSVEMRVSGLECASCAESIGRRLGRIRGVESASFDPAKNVAKIKLHDENTVTLTAVREALKGLGYTPGDALVTVRGSIEANGQENVLSLPHQKGAFVIDGGTASGAVTITGNVMPGKPGEPDRIKPQ